MERYNIDSLLLLLDQQPVNNILMEKYKILGKIGSGAYSNVLKAMQISSGVVVALKQIEIPADEIMQNRIFGREIRTLQLLGGHPNIIKLIEVFKQKKLIYLVFEYIPMDLITFYKALKQKQKRSLNDQEITYIFKQICSGLEYMHSRRIIHRDIKPENILINPVTLKVKLIDFGFSKVFVEKEINTEYIVTRWYRPIEVVLGLPYDYKVDIFSIGALLLQLYTGRQVFRSASNIDQLYWICFICGYPYWQPALDKIKDLNLNVTSQNGSVIKSLIKNIRPQGQNLIMQMLKITPHHRPSIFQIIEHPYFTKNNQIPKNINDLSTNKRTMSQYQQRPKQNSQTENQKYPTSHKIDSDTMLKNVKQMVTDRQLKQQNVPIYRKSQRQNNLNLVKQKINNSNTKTTQRKQVVKQNKIQISNLINKSLGPKHSRKQSGDVSNNQNGNSSHLNVSTSQNRDYIFSKNTKPFAQNITQRKLHRMSNY